MIHAHNWRGRCWFSLLLILALSSGLSGAESLSKLVSPMNDTAGLELKGDAQVVHEGPKGEKVLRTTGSFSGHVDLKSKRIDPKDHDLLKMEVKADARAFLRLSLENYPQPGDLSHWYVLDTARGAFGWRTIWLDLRRPEEIKPAGAYKGMAEKDPTARGLRFTGSVANTKRSIQGHWLRPKTPAGRNSRHIHTPEHRRGRQPVCGVSGWPLTSPSKRPARRLRPGRGSPPRRHQRPESHPPRSHQTQNPGSPRPSHADPNSADYKPGRASRLDR